MHNNDFAECTRRKTASSRFHALPVIAVLIVSAACSERAPNNVGYLPNAYAATLLLSQQYRSDSVVAATAIDSAVRTYGYDDRADVEQELKQLTHDPDRLRTMLDSTQHLLETTKQGK
jgi:hypothetical protein